LAQSLERGSGGTVEKIPVFDGGAEHTPKRLLNCSNFCHSERSEESLFLLYSSIDDYERFLAALGMTNLGVFLATNEGCATKIGWGGWTRTNTVLINSEVPYRLDHAPAALCKLSVKKIMVACESRKPAAKILFRGLGGETGFGPRAPAAVHRDGVGVAHLL
jgi:hypothetical protein